MQTEEDFPLDTKLEDIEEFDSLARLGFMTLIDEKYGVEVDPDELAECVTFKKTYSNTPISKFRGMIDPLNNDGCVLITGASGSIGQTTALCTAKYDGGQNEVWLGARKASWKRRPPCWKTKRPGLYLPT